MPAPIDILRAALPDPNMPGSQPDWEGVLEAFQQMQDLLPILDPTNTLLGIGAGAALTTGTNNTAIGADALPFVTEGNDNTMVGQGAGGGLDADSAENSFLGKDAGGSGSGAQVASQSAALGAKAGLDSPGARNLFLGYGAGSGVADDDRLFVDNRIRSSPDSEALVSGEFADARLDQWLAVNGVLRTLDGAITLLDGQGNGGQGNISIGVGLNSTIDTSPTQGFANTRIGYKAGASITTGIGNTFIGENAGKSCTSGFNNTAIGWDSQLMLTTGTNNTSLGEDALKYVTGDGNTGVGYTAGYSITSGLRNAAYSPLSLYQLTTGSYNAAYGHNSGFGANGGSSRNVFLGYGTYNGANAEVNDIVAIGYCAGYHATGSRNVFIGQSAGLQETESDRLVIANRAGGSGSALLYGIFNAAGAALQSLEVNGNLLANAATSIGWSDAPMWRDDAGQIALRDGANPQSLAVYGTYAPGSYERYRIRATGSAYVLGAEAETGEVRRVEQVTSISDGYAIRTTADAASVKVAALEAPNLSAGSDLYLEMGPAAGGGNAALFGFHYAGLDDPANRIMLGFASAMTALNVSASGRVGVGAVEPSYALEVEGPIGFNPGAAVDPVQEGDVVFELTSDTALTVKVKGLDGIVRSAVIPLS